MDVRKLLLQQLGELLHVEETLADEVLPELERKVSERHLREALTAHREQTHGHVQRMEQAFDRLKEKPQRHPSHGFAGLRKQHEETVGRLVSAPLRDLYCASSAAQTEHFEISSYHSAITLANIAGEPEIVRLLDANLHEEEDALEKVEKALPERLAGVLAPA